MLPSRSLVNAILFAPEDIVGGGGGSSVRVGVVVGTAVGTAVAIGAVVGVGVGVSSAPQAPTKSRVNRPNDTAKTLKLRLYLAYTAGPSSKECESRRFQNQAHSGRCGQKPVFKTRLENLRILSLGFLSSGVSEGCHQSMSSPTNLGGQRTLTDDHMTRNWPDQLSRPLRKELW